MANNELTVDLDYVNRTTRATLVRPFLNDEVHPRIFRLYDEHGAIMQDFIMTHQSGSHHHNTWVGTGTFDKHYNYDNNYGGYDSSIARTDLSGVYAGIVWNSWEMSSEFDFGGTTSLLENGLLGSVYTILDKRDDMYTGASMIISDGDCVAQGIVDGVIGDNFVVFSYDKAAAEITGYNLNNSICQVISGANEGEVFSVTDHADGSTGITVDRKVDHLSGQIIRVMPRRIVTEYSGWDYTGTDNSNLGGPGITSRFGFDETIPNKVGSIAYTTGTYSGSRAVSHPLSPGADFFTAGIIALKNDPYMRTVMEGDVVYYNPAAAPSTTATGVVIYTGGHDVAAEGDFHIQVWPHEAADPGSTYTIHRCNKMDLQYYPDLDSKYLAICRVATGISEGEQVTTYVETPSVEVDFAANEFESQFPTITETTHFHFGPINLSNGQTLFEDRVGENGEKPTLYITGHAEGGDPSNPYIHASIDHASTLNPDAAHKFGGDYFYKGIMTLATSITFNSSQTLLCDMEARYGSIKLHKVFTLPVQPSV